MSHLMHKPVRIGKYTIPALLLLALVIGTVVATVYVVLQFTTEATVQANPKVCFVQWPATKQNTFTETFNIFPGVKTVDDNATHGIWNDDGSAHNITLHVTGLTNSGNITSWMVNVINATGGTAATISSVCSPVTIEIPAYTKYTIYIEVTAAAGAVPTTTCEFTIDMKVENP